MDVLSPIGKTTRRRNKTVPRIHILLFIRKSLIVCRQQHQYQTCFCSCCCCHSCGPHRHHNFFFVRLNESDSKYDVVSSSEQIFLPWVWHSHQPGVWQTIVSQLLGDDLYGYAFEQILLYFCSFCIKMFLNTQAFCIQPPLALCSAITLFKALRFN